MVTVVDAKNFLSDWRSEDDLRARAMALSEEDERSIADLLVEQVEFANVLIISKLDLVSPQDGTRLMDILRHLNPDAWILPADRGRVSLSSVLGTGLFDFDKAAQAPGWLKELRGEHVPETEEFGIGSFIYRARVPFHPERLWKLLQDFAMWKGVLRSKGFVWLATRMDDAGLWSHAGGAASFGSSGPWYAALADDALPDDAELRADWQKPYGDRRQELVFIGVDLDDAELRRKLDDALLTASELVHGPERWAELRDPFPSWSDETA